MIEMAVGIAAAVFKSDFETVLKKSMTASMSNYNSQQDKSSWDNIQTKVATRFLVPNLPHILKSTSFFHLLFVFFLLS